MNIVVVGPGAIGCLFGARLARSGNKVFMLDHDPARAARIADEGLAIEGRDRLAAEAGAGVSAEDAPESQLVLFCVKSYDTEEAAGAVAKLPGVPHVLTLQNGLGNAEALAQAVGPERVSVGATSCGVTRLGPGKVRHAGEGLTHLAPWTKGAADGTRLAADALRGAGFDVFVSDDPNVVLWRKLIVNAAMNALSAIAGVPNGKLAELPQYRVMLVSCAREVACVAEALGVHVDKPEDLVLYVCEETSENISSMLQDVRRGRRTEVEAIYGAIVSESARLGVETPVTEELLRAARALEGGEKVGEGQA